MTMDLVRIGDKLISRRKLQRAIDKILERRAAGASQQDVAAELGIDRAVVSPWRRWAKCAKATGWPWSAFPWRTRTLEALARGRRDLSCCLATASAGVC